MESALALLVVVSLVSNHVNWLQWWLRFVSFKEFDLLLFRSNLFIPHPADNLENDLLKFLDIDIGKGIPLLSLDTKNLPFFLFCCFFQLFFLRDVLQHCDKLLLDDFDLIHV